MLVVIARHIVGTGMLVCIISVVDLSNAFSTNKV